MRNKCGFYASVVFGFIIAMIWICLSYIEYLEQYLIGSDFAWYWFLSISAITLIANIVDKMLAIYVGGSCRIPSMLLHFLSLLGGGPATAFSMIVFNHKSSRKKCQVDFIVCCICHLFLLALAVGIKYYHLDTNPSSYLDMVMTLLEFW